MNLATYRYHSEVAPNPFAKKLPIPNVGRIVLTTSCKGGVGKSTVALNTAIALAKAGHRVGLLDADVYGPSIPTMTNTNGMPLQMTQDEKFLPVYAHGIETVSVGNAVGKESALMWKGPLIGGLIGQLMKQSQWSTLDYLIVDTPPGTGDVQMALYDSAPIDGSLIVTSPQNVAMADVIRNVDMFNKMKIPVLGVVQNMDGFVCPCCKEVTKIFDGKLAEEMAKKNNYEMLASIPIDPTLSQCADKGIPAILQHPDSSYAKMFDSIAKKIVQKLPKKQAEPK